MAPAACSCPTPERRGDAPRDQLARGPHRVLDMRVSRCGGGFCVSEQLSHDGQGKTRIYSDRRERMTEVVKA